MQATRNAENAIRAINRVRERERECIERRKYDKGRKKKELSIQKDEDTRILIEI